MGNYNGIYSPAAPSSIPVNGDWSVIGVSCTSLDSKGWGATYNNSELWYRENGSGNFVMIEGGTAFVPVGGNNSTGLNKWKFAANQPFGKSAGYVEFYVVLKSPSPSTNTYKYQMPTIKVIVGEVQSGDYTFTAANVSELTGDFAATCNGVTITEGMAYNKGEEIKLTAKNNKDISSAVITVNGSARNFVISSDLQTATYSINDDEINSVSFSVATVEHVDPLYSFTQMNINDMADAHVSGTAGGVKIEVGTPLFNKSDIILTADSGFVFKSASVLLNWDSTEKFTISGDKHTASLHLDTFYDELFSFQFNIETEGAAPAETGLKFTESDINLFTEKGVSLSVNGAPVTAGSVIKSGNELKFTANNGFEIDSVSMTVEGSEIVFTVSENSKNATATVPALESVVENKTWVIETRAVTPEVESDFNVVFKVDSEILTQVNKQRFRLESNNSGGEVTYETVDYGKYILGLIKLPFAIASDLVLKEEEIPLGNITTGVLAPKVRTDLIKLDMGLITVPETFNDVRDYAGTTAILHLPRASSVNIDLEYVIGQSLRVVYAIDAYSGLATINVTSERTGEVIVTKTADIGISIPYINLVSQSPDNNQIDLSGDNGVKIPFIELVRSDAVLPLGFFTIPVMDEGKLNGYTGFVQVENVELKTKATAAERDLIQRQLSEGVIIK